MIHLYLGDIISNIFSLCMCVCTCLTIFPSILDPIVKEQGRLTIVSSSPTPMAGSVPVGE